MSNVTLILTKVPREAAEYIIEEFARKPIDSQITYSYEQIDTLRHKEAPVNKCLQSVVAHQTSLRRPKTNTVETLVNARINQFESIGDETSQALRRNDASSSSFQSYTEVSAKTRQHMAKPFSAVSVSQDQIWVIESFWRAILATGWLFKVVFFNLIWLPLA